MECSDSLEVLEVDSGPSFLQEDANTLNESTIGCTVECSTTEGGMEGKRERGGGGRGRELNKEESEIHA